MQFCRRDDMRKIYENLFTIKTVFVPVLALVHADIS